MPDTVTRRNLSRGGASSGSELPDFASPPACRFRSAPPSRMPDPGESSDCPRLRTATVRQRSYMKSARTTTAGVAQQVTCARPSRSDATKPLVDGRSRSPPQGSGALHSTPGRPHRDSARLDAFGIMRTSTVSKHAKPPPAAPDIRPSTAKASANGRSAVRFHGNDLPPSHRRDRGKIAQGRGKPGRSVYSSPCPDFRERHFPYTSPRPAFSVFFISEMIVIGPTPPGTGVM